MSEIKCVLTRKIDDVVVLLKPIPGKLESHTLSVYNIYFPVEGELPKIGDVWVGPEDCKI